MKKEKEKRLRVKELIALLQKQPPDAFISTEGCDCFGDVGSVAYVDTSGWSTPIDREDRENREYGIVELLRVKKSDYESDYE